MKRHVHPLIATLAVGAGLLLASASASAGVDFSVGISAPLGGGARIGTVISSGGHAGVRVKPAPLYRAAPVVYAPAPVIYAPPVYGPPVYGPPPVYLPAPVVYAPPPVVYRSAPVVYRPAPVYRPRVVYAPVGARPGHHHPPRYDGPKAPHRGGYGPVAMADGGHRR